MSSSMCMHNIISFLERVIGRLTFEEVEKLFSKALDKNPIFLNIMKKGAFGKNIVVILGGRGCGKTLIIRYIKHYFSGNGWDFTYIEGKELKGEKSLDILKQIVDKIERGLRENPNYKIVIAIDDVVEVDEIARDQLKNIIISIVYKYAGRIKLVLAAQSERITAEGATTIQLLKIVLGQAPYAELFFGEHPEEVIERSFRNSYINRNPVMLFRGASIVNLDAYWSSLRSLENTEKLADVIVKIVEFYISNIGDSCSELVDEVKKYKYGLALLALSSLPKIADPAEKIVIEYKGPIHQDIDSPASALNGLGIAELLLGFFRDTELKNLAEEADKMYSYLKKTKVVGSISTEVIKKVILDASEILPYVDVVRDATISVIGLSLPQESAGRGKRRKYGPKIDLIHIIRGRIAEGREEHSFIILHDLRTDKRGYISSSTLNKLKKLVELGVPSESEARYLVVIVPSRKYMKAVYKSAPIMRIGRDILVVLADSISSLENSLIHLLYSNASPTEEMIEPDFKVTKEILYIMYKLMIGTILFNLRDHNGMPQLAYYLLPTIH